MGVGFYLAWNGMEKIGFTWKRTYCGRWLLFSVEWHGESWFHMELFHVIRFSLFRKSKIKPNPIRSRHQVRISSNIFELNLIENLS